MSRPARAESPSDTASALPKPEDIRLDAADERQVLAAQVLLAARGLVGGSLIHMALAIILVPMLAGDGDLDFFSLMVWAGTLILAALCRFAAALYFTVRKPADLLLGKVLLVATGLLVGAVWGALPVLFFSGGGQMEDVLIAFVLGGVALGALTVSGYYLPSFYALFLPAFTPLVIVHFLVGENLQTGMATMLVLFWIAVVIFGRRFSNSLLSLLRLRVLRDALFEQLRTARDEAEAANRAKSEFLATISHEIRTPMNGVLGAIDLLLDSPLDEQQAPFARIAQDAGESLRRLLDDLLDISRIEAGRLDLVELDFSPAELVASSVDIFRPDIARKGLALEIALAPDLPQRLSGDPLRLRQILVNLIGNAVKFTGQGGISISLAPCPPGDGESGPCLRLEVRDSGVGIAPDFHDRMFTKFSREVPPGDDHPGGTGLGLAIVRGLVERMRGRLGFASEPGTGSLFWCEIPLAPAHAPSDHHGPEKPPDGKALAGLHLLLADDSETNRILLGEMLRRAGARVEEADGGAAAIERAAAASFDLLLMDISMPGMDGVETLARIRAGDADGPPAIALTAQSAGSDGALFRSRGFVAALLKPVRRHELIEMVLRHAAGRRAVEDTPFVEPAATDPRADLSPRLHARFLAEARERRVQIRKALAAGDQVAAREQAHALKGTAATFGAHALARLAAELEACRGTDREPALLDGLDHAIETLADAAPRKVT